MFADLQVMRRVDLNENMLNSEQICVGDAAGEKMKGKNESPTNIIFRHRKCHFMNGETMAKDAYGKK